MKKIGDCCLYIYKDAAKLQFFDEIHKFFAIKLLKSIQFIVI